GRRPQPARRRSDRHRLSRQFPRMPRARRPLRGRCPDQPLHPAFAAAEDLPDVRARPRALPDRIERLAAASTVRRLPGWLARARDMPRSAALPCGSDAQRQEGAMADGDFKSTATVASAAKPAETQTATVRYIDRPECAETFADAVNQVYFDGQSLR